MERGTWVDPVAGKVTLPRVLEPMAGAATRPSPSHGRALRERATDPHPSGARRPRAGQDRTGQGARLALGDAQGRQAWPDHDRQVLPAAARHPEHGRGRRADPAEPVCDSGRRPGEDAGTADRLDPPGVRDRRHDRAPVPGDGARGRVRRAAPRRDAGAHPRARRPSARADQGGRAVPTAQGRIPRPRPTEVRRGRPHRGHPGHAQTRAGGAPCHAMRRRGRRASCSVARRANRCVGRPGTRRGAGRWPSWASRA